MRINCIVVERIESNKIKIKQNKLQTSTLEIGHVLGSTEVIVKT